MWVSSGCPLASFRLVGVFLVPRLLYGCGLWKTAYQIGAVLGSVFLRRVWGGCGSGCAVRPCGGLVVWIVAASLPFMVVALGLVSVSPDYSGRAVVLSVVWVCGLFWRVSCLGASVLPLVCLRRSVRVVPRSFLLPLVLVVGRCLGVGSFLCRRFCCLWCVPLVSFRDCIRCRFICRCSVWVCLFWVCLFRVCGRCGRCGVVTYCTSCKDHTFAPVFNL